MSHHVSVVIPVFNDTERLAACLAALEAQTWPRGAYDVVVVDNASTQDIAAVVARFAKARLLRETQVGSYVARNRGVAAAEGDILAFTDADCLPARDWIERGVAALLAHPGCGLVGGRVDVFFRDPARPGAVELYDATRGFLQQKYIAADRYAATANMFTFRRVFTEVGPFDAALKSYGDVEWGRRVAAAGFALVYADDVVIAHPARHSLAALRQRIVRVAGGLHDLEHRHLDLPGDHPGLGKVPQLLSATWRNPHLPTLGMKLRVLAVFAWVQGVKLVERGRLKLGGVSRR